MIFGLFRKYVMLNPVKQVDAWSGFHAFGPYFLCDVFNYSTVIATVILWEVLDLCFSIFYNVINSQEHTLQFGKNGYFWYDFSQQLKKVFDPRGLSYVDILLGIAFVGIHKYLH